MQRPEPEIISDNRRRALFIALAASIVPALVVAVVALVLFPWWLAIIAAVVVGTAIFALGSRDAEGRMTKRLGATPIDPARHARLVNLVEGLSLQAGVQEPKLYVVEDEAVNALVLGRDGARAVIVVTSGLYDVLDRVELEASLAQLLAQLRAGDTAPRTAAVAYLSPLAAISAGAYGRVIERIVDPDRRFRNDAAGVSITRFPPGLVGALDKASKGSAQPAQSPSAMEHLWMVAPRQGSQTHPLTETRIAALREL